MLVTAHLRRIQNPGVILFKEQTSAGQGKLCALSTVVATDAEHEKTQSPFLFLQCLKQINPLNVKKEQQGLCHCGTVVDLSETAH